jgi:hypothetical protein
MIEINKNFWGYPTKWLRLIRISEDILPNDWD